MERIINLLKTNDVTLFIGAGSSIDLGGPTGKQLLLRIKSQFSDVKYSNPDNFFEVCKNILNSDIHSRPELEKFVKKQLDGLFPQENHVKLVTLPWKCVFTTNYDTVLERIPDEKLKGRSLRPVINNHPKIEFNRSDLLYYIKIFGSIDISYKEEGFPVLSSTDFTTSFLRRSDYYNIFKDCIMRGPIVFLGYSFDDDLIFTLLTEIKESLGADVTWTSYAISPNEPSESNQRLFTKFNIVHIKGTFESFVSKAHDSLKDGKFEPKHSEKTIFIHGSPLDIPLSIDRPSQEHFYFLNSTSTESNYKDIKKFFSGEDSSFYPFLKGWDFKREIYSFNGKENPQLCHRFGNNIPTGIKNVIFNQITNPNSEENLITFLTGTAGCGKTIILKRLAFDWYSNGLPVIFMEPHGTNVDSRQVDSFIEYIQNNYKPMGAKPAIHTKPRILIVCDHCGIFLQEFIRLFEFLSSRGKLVTMIIAERENRLPKYIKEKNITYSLPESISKEELTDFKKYLQSAKLVETDAEIYSLINNPEINDSLFALMYTIIDDSRRPLNQIIHGQYMSLNDWYKQVYEYVCLFNNYNVNLNEDLLVRSTIKNYKQFIHEVNTGQLKKVIFPIDSEWDNVDYRVHHPIIAQRTVKIEMNDPTIKVQKLFEIFSNINPNYSHERKIIEHILVYEIGPKSPEREIPINLKRELFELVCSKISSRPIYHHYALLELSDDNEINFDFAEELLKKALSLEQNGERDELLFTTFGKLFTLKGLKFEDDGKTDDAFHAFQTAERFFINGRTKFFKNAYSYHGQIALHRKQAERSHDDIEKIKYFSKALDLCEEAINNLSEVEHDFFLQEEIKIHHLLGNINDFEILVERLANEYNSASGYFLKAYLMYVDSLKIKDQATMKDSLMKTLEVIKKGQTVEELNNGLLKLEAKIVIKTSPDDIDKQYQILKKWYDFTDHQDLNLLFKYGIILFSKDLYEKSKEVFDDLDIQSQGLKQRSTMGKGQYLTKNDQKIEFKGKITSVSHDGQHAFIQCLSLPNLKYQIPARPRFDAHVNDYVIFNIAFNMRGIFGASTRPD